VQRGSYREHESWNQGPLGAMQFCLAHDACWYSHTVLLNAPCGRMMGCVHEAHGQHLLRLSESDLYEWVRKHQWQALTSKATAGREVWLQHLHSPIVHYVKLLEPAAQKYPDLLNQQSHSHSKVHTGILFAVDTHTCLGHVAHQQLSWVAILSVSHIPA
jgi:hypothetical protein